MNSKQRVKQALSHKETDRVPFDCGGMPQSGIHSTAYKRLIDYADIDAKGDGILNIITQAASMEEAVHQFFGSDFRIVYGEWANPCREKIQQDGEYTVFRNEWDMVFRRPKHGGFYYDLYASPLSGADYKQKQKEYKWPDPEADWRFDNIKENAERFAKLNKAVVLMGLCPGIFEVSQWLRGSTDFLMDLALDKKSAEFFLDKLSEIKIKYWLKALDKAQGNIDFISEVDDMASQQNLLFSPETYRSVIKKYHRRIVQAIKGKYSEVKVIFHSCGAIRDLIPDLIEIGVDALNPVQFTAKGMELERLKRDFGREVVLWGGGVDTQGTLSTGNKKTIKIDVTRNLEIMSKDGGYIFSPVHIIQPDVPPENIVYMKQAFYDFFKS